jgi:hypothetical protein
LLGSRQVCDAIFHAISSTVEEKEPEHESN